MMSMLDFVLNYRIMLIISHICLALLL
jgi:hypothetical protein